jgi:cytidine deaminase
MKKSNRSINEVILADLNMSMLMAKALEAMQRTYSPYSHYPVGAALLTRGRRFYVGTNIENASYGLTICAERVAVFNAIANGEFGDDMEAMVVVTRDLGTSCGACRQVLYEFNPDMIMYFCKVNEFGNVLERSIYKLSNLLVDPFSLKG